MHHPPAARQEFESDAAKRERGERERDEARDTFEIGVRCVCIQKYQAKSDECEPRANSKPERTKEKEETASEFLAKPSQTRKESVAVA